MIPATKWATVEDAVESGIFVKKIYVHKSFNGFNFEHDIALLELEKEIPNKTYTKVELVAPPSDNVRVKAVGYGAINDAGTSARRCRMVDVVYRDFDWCIKNEPYPGDDFSPLHQLCAVSVGWPSGNTDTCYGDSGGPLYQIGTGDDLHQVGITSFSNSGCATFSGIPWYIRTVSYRKDIVSIIETDDSPNFDSFSGDRTNVRAWNDPMPIHATEEPVPEPSSVPQ